MFTFPLSLFSSGSIVSGLGTLIGGNTALNNPSTIGATLIKGGSSWDDDSVVVPDIGFNFNFYGTNYRTNIYVGSNSYITFGFSSTAYSSLSTTNPGRGILIDAKDNSYQNVYGISKANNYVIRYEGSNSTSGTSGSPSRVWETTLFNDGVIQIVIGSISIGGTSIITKGTGTTGEFINLTITANSSLVAVPSANNYVVYNNSYYA